MVQRAFVRLCLSPTGIQYKNRLDKSLIFNEKFNQYNVKWGVVINITCFLKNYFREIPDHIDPIERAYQTKHLHKKPTR